LFFKDPENISVVDIESKYYSAYNAGFTDYKMSIAWRIGACLIAFLLNT